MSNLILERVVFKAAIWYNKKKLAGGGLSLDLQMTGNMYCVNVQVSVAAFWRIAMTVFYKIGSL